MKKIRVTFYFWLILDGGEFDYLSREIEWPYQVIPCVGNSIIFNPLIFDLRSNRSGISNEDQYNLFINRNFEVGSITYFQEGGTEVTISCLADYKTKDNIFL
jgi:hypothetical protein